MSEASGWRSALLLLLLLVVAGALGVVLALAGATLASPRWLHLAWLAPALLACDHLATRWRRACRRRLGEEAAVAGLVEGRARGLRGLKAFLAASAVLALAVAAARPQWGTSDEEIRRKGVDVLVCVDTSKSMLAEDLRPSRIARARIAVESLVDRLGGDRVGLVAFAGDARLLCPLTLDHSAAKLFLDVLDVDVIDRPGTSLAPALRLALRTLPEERDRHAVVVLITDGEDHGGEAVAAAEELAAAGVVVHAVGIGRPEGAPIPITVEDSAGVARQAYLEDEEGNVVMSRLDVATLQAVATATGGSFQAASSSEMELKAIAGEIARMEQAELGTRRRTVRTERYAWFVGIAFLLLVAEGLLPDGAGWRRWGGRPRVARMARAAEAGAARRPAA